MIAASLWMLLGAANSSVRFVDVTQEAGIAFQHRNGGGGDKHLVETMSGGGGFWDYDGDGDLDVYLLNGAPLPGYRGPGHLRNALYRNEAGNFRDVTEEAGLSGSGYSMGCAAADYDNDGDVDLFVSGFGPSHLYRNEGDGTFTDVTQRAGVGTVGFAASTAFADIEGDGDLDLYVTTYIEYQIDNPVYCGDRTLGVRTYCHPNNYVGASDLLYRNEGDGTFSDVSMQTGVGLKPSRGLGVIFTDDDDDGDADIYVANDTMMNHFFRNLGSGRFEEIALALGLGFDEDGRAEGSMGVDVGDFDRDGHLDVFVTNFESEGNTIYRNLGGGNFVDATYAAQLALPSLSWVGFGTGFFDFDNDTDLDLFVANGHIMDHGLSDVTRHAQPKQIYENERGAYRDISHTAGKPFDRDQVGRGTAFGDWDDDGDPDVLVMNNNDVPNLLRNDTENGNHWIQLRLVGRASNRDGIGARVRVDAGDNEQIDELRCGYSYLSMHDLRIHFGLG
ncbi:MAG TPA: CRTAC1 family protein, partial [Vicinamibacteria bacterium]|nr:CRTAC1 family protein [Vicinamibacteria bacterium]